MPAGPAFADTRVSEPVVATLLARARRHEVSGAPHRACALYRRIAELPTFAALALTECARVERDQGMLDAAIDSLTQALHHCTDPHCTEDAERSRAIYLELGDVHAQRGDYDEAAYHYRRALFYEPDRVEVQRRLRCASRLRALAALERSA